MSSGIYFECKKCGTYLPENTALDDNYICPACGSKMVETAMRDMMNEVNKSYNKYSSCPSCGGQFPSHALMNGECPIDRKLTIMIIGKGRSNLGTGLTSLTGSNRLGEI